MLVMPPAGSSAIVRDGIYEITDSVSGQYLNSIAADIYNRYCDDALILQDKPSRLGKVCLYPVYGDDGLLTCTRSGRSPASVTDTPSSRSQAAYTVLLQMETSYCHRQWC